MYYYGFRKDAPAEGFDADYLDAFNPQWFAFPVSTCDPPSGFTCEEIGSNSNVLVVTTILEGGETLKLRLSTLPLDACQEAGAEGLRFLCADHNNGQQLSDGAIVGIVVGALIAVGLAIFVALRRRAGGGPVSDALL